MEPASFDFGNVRPEKTLQKELVLRNVGDAELVIKKVSTTCNCTVAGAYLERLRAGGEHDACASQFTTPAAPGRTEQTVTIETNDPEHPKVEVKVKATVVAPANAARARTAASGGLVPRRG